MSLATGLLTSLVSLRLPRQATSVFGLLSSLNLKVGRWQGVSWQWLIVVTRNPSSVSPRLPSASEAGLPTSVFGLLSSDLPQFNSASKNALSPLSGKLFIATYKSNGYANVFN